MNNDQHVIDLAQGVLSVLFKFIGKTNLDYKKVTKILEDFKEYIENNKNYYKKEIKMKKGECLGKCVSLKDLKGSDIGKMVADHGMKKEAMKEKMSYLRESKGKK